MQNFVSPDVLSLLRRLWRESPLSLLFPRLCASCEAELFYPEREICTACLFALPETDFHLTPPANPAYFRLAGGAPISAAAACCFYEKGGKLRRLVHRFKYESAPGLAVELGAFWGEKLRDSPLLAGVEAITPTPLHSDRQRERGYNQAEKFASGFAKAVGKPINVDCVRRVKKTERQTGKNRIERRLNVQNAFLAQNPPQSLLLIDDVLTTGATLEALAFALHAAGARDIRVLTLGIAY